MTTTPVKMTIFGREYEVTHNPNAEDVGFVYELRGPKGAHYGLTRSRVTPSSLFAVNLVNWMKSTPFDGLWFRERDDGTLVFFSGYGRK